MAISKRLRFEILKRDGFKCRYCGKPAAERELRVDHVTPVALGGRDEPSNLVASCEPCNSGKSSSSPDAPLVAGVEDDALLWSQAMKRAAEKAAEEHGTRLAYRKVFESAWTAWTYESGGERKTFELPPDWRQSIETFRIAGLPDFLLEEIVDTTMNAQNVKKLFNYFAGVAWKRIEQLQDSARTALGDGSAAPIWDDLLRESVLNAAVYVWQSFWMPEHQAEPGPELVAEFRRKAAEVFPGEFSAGDLLLAAEASGEYGFDDLNESLDCAREGYREVWHHSDATTQWLERWRETGDGEAADPTEDQQLVLRRQAIAAHRAGYDGTAINHAAFKAGEAHDPELLDHLDTARDALRLMDEYDARLVSIPQEAARLWLDTLNRIWGETWTPGAADIEKFAQHVAEFVPWHGDEDILEAALMAGSENDRSIAKYLPRRTGWGAE